MRIAFLTMCGNDNVWLRKWVRHNEQFVADKFSLYVILDGEDEEAREIAKGCSVIVMPRIDGPGSFERRRMRFIRAYVSSLKVFYKVVVFNDVDEFLCIHPDEGTSLTERLLEPTQMATVVTPIGIEMLYQDGDPDLDLDRPLLEQRPIGYINTNYCKPSIFYGNFQAGNQHIVRGEPLVVDPSIYMFHARYADQKMLEGRIKERDTQLSSGFVNGAAGWKASAATEEFERHKENCMAQPEQRLGQENFQDVLKFMSIRYKNRGNPGRRTFGRFRVPDAMSAML